MVLRYGFHVERCVRNRTTIFCVIMPRLFAGELDAPATATEFLDRRPSAAPCPLLGRTLRTPIASVRWHIREVCCRVPYELKRIAVPPDLAIGPRPTWDTRAPPGCQHPTPRKVAIAGNADIDTPAQSSQLTDGAEMAWCDDSFVAFKYHHRGTDYREAL